MNSTILLLGGLGFIGKNLLQLICSNKLFSLIITVDK